MIEMNQEFLEEKLKILIVDDEREIANLFKEYLELFNGYEVSVVYSGMEALGDIRQNKPDLIILDFVMPGLNGIKVTEMLRNNPETENIPIILTSVVDDPLGVEGRKQNNIKFLEKPIDFMKLDKLVALNCKN